LAEVLTHRQQSPSRRPGRSATWLLACWLTLALSATGDTIVVDPAAQYQVVEGWGTSLCWWANVVGGWDDDKRDAVADLLFDLEKGIGLNVVRYNIGGGDAPDHKHMRVGGAVPGYKPTADAPYDWSADANQRRILVAAIARGANVTEAFANSPPWWMTNSGCSSGSEDPKTDNLRDDCYDSFAEYLADVVKHFRDEWGITFDTLDPCNEPGANWWKAGKGQEGCRFGKPAQARIVNAVSAALAKRGLPTRIGAIDSHSIDWMLWHFRAYDDAAKSAIHRLNVHAYKGERRAEVRNMAERYGKRLWMSEVDHASRVGEHGHDHESMHPALVLAEAIIRDLRDLQPQAWVFWQAMENEQYCKWWKYNYGLLHGDLMYGKQTWHVTPKYYAMGQFSKFVRPGQQMVGIGADDTVAFMDWKTDRLVIVSTHRGDKPRERRYDLSNLNVGKPTVSVRRTAAGEGLADLPDAVITDGVLSVTEEENSVTTYIVERVRYCGFLKLNDTVQNGVNRFEFVGEWGFKGHEPLAFTRDNHWGWRTDDYYNVHFRGTQIRLHAAKAPNGGIAAISLDGGEETLIDCYTPERQDQALIYTSPVLPEGEHVLKVRVTGDKNAASSHPVIAADRADIVP